MAIEAKNFEFSQIENDSDVLTKNALRRPGAQPLQVGQKVKFRFVGGNFSINGEALNTGLYIAILGGSFPSEAEGVDKWRKYNPYKLVGNVYDKNGNVFCNKGAIIDKIASTLEDFAESDEKLVDDIVDINKSRALSKNYKVAEVTPYEDKNNSIKYVYTFE